MTSPAARAIAERYIRTFHFVSENRIEREQAELAALIDAEFAGVREDLKGAMDALDWATSMAFVRQALARLDPEAKQ